MDSKDAGARTYFLHTDCTPWLKFDTLKAKVGFIKESRIKSLLFHNFGLNGCKFGSFGSFNTFSLEGTPVNTDPIEHDAKYGENRLNFDLDPDF